jgi:hypothetical protein
MKDRVAPDPDDVPEPDEEAGDACEACGHPWAEHTVVDPQTRVRTTLRACRVMQPQQPCACAGYR